MMWNPAPLASSVITLEDIRRFGDAEREIRVKWNIRSNFMAKMPSNTKSGNKLRTKDIITGSGSHKQKHPFSYGFKGDSSMLGKRKIRKTK